MPASKARKKRRAVLQIEYAMTAETIRLTKELLARGQDAVNKMVQLYRTDLNAALKLVRSQSYAAEFDVAFTAYLSKCTHATAFQLALRKVIIAPIQEKLDELTK